MNDVLLVAAFVSAVLIASAAILFIFRRKPSCCEADGESEKRIKVQDKNPDHYPYCVRISISGMNCRRCGRRVENALNTKGTVWAIADVKEGTALVRMKEALPDDTLRKIVSRLGFTVMGIERLD